MDIEDTDEAIDSSVLPIEEEARKQGWLPQNEFKGDKSRWVDADQFVKNGETLVPLLKAKVKKLEQKLNMSVQAVESLQQHFHETTKAAVEKAKKDVLDEIKQARNEGDVDAEEEARERYEQIKEYEKQQTPVVQQPNVHPDFQEWLDENPWYGNTDDEDDTIKTSVVEGIARNLKAKGEEATGRKFFDKVMQKYNEKYNKQSTQKYDKVSGSRTSSGAQTSVSYESLSSKQKEVCKQNWNMVKTVYENAGIKMDERTFREKYARDVLAGEQ